VSAASTHSVRLILNTALWLTALGVVVRASGAIKEIIFAAAFGVSRDTDAFVLAVTYATFLPAVFGGAIATALVAHLSNVKAQGSRLSSAGLTSMMQWISTAGILCAIFIYLMAPVLLAALFSLDGDQLEKAVAFSRILAPLGAAMIWASAIDAVLNSAKQFYFPAITALATPVMMMAWIIAAGSTWGVEAAAWGMLVGGLAEVVILIVRIRWQWHGLFKNLSEVHGADPHAMERQAVRISAFWRAVGFLSFAGSIAALAAVVDQVFLSKLEPGAVTNFNYAYKVNSLLIGLFGNAFAVAIYPYLSDLAAARDIAGLKRLSLRLAAVVIPVTAAVSLIVYVFSFQIVELLFVRGNFSRDSAVEVGAIQQIFAFQLVFYVGGLLATRVLNAARATGFILWISCIGLASVTVFDWMFYTVWGAKGIALAAVLTSTVTLVAALLFIRRSFAANAH
jgi:putative peptidoglycan lipid II flippase